MNPKTVYLTTPLYYVNARPHIGHAYTTIAADIFARYKRMRGEKVFLLTGTDEHGAKIEEAAAAAKKTPQAYADEISQSFRDLWTHLDVKFDDFIRTTEDRHKQVVEEVFKKLLASKDIFKGRYSGFYCVSCETYWTESELGDSKVCLTCKKPLTHVEEDSYFFALSRYQAPLLAYYKEHPGFLRPSHRANEVIRFVESGLKDLSISRTKINWGVKVPGDPSHTVYVWFDALLNYISGAGYLAKEPDFAALWPAEVQLVGKEIYRFHAVIWAAMLMALKLPLPRRVFAHGWWTVEGEKMSKSKGNFIEPEEITREYGIDAFRYFLFREMPFGNDGDFSREMMRQRYNADLANDLGNLLSRTVQMVDKYLGGELPRKPLESKQVLSKEIEAQTTAVYEAMDQLAFNEALNRIWACVSKLNKEIDTQKPWVMAKTDLEKVRALLFDLVWSLRTIASWIEPFMPQTSAKMKMELGVRRSESFSAEEVLTGASGAKVHKSPPLFPRK